MSKKLTPEYIAMRTKCDRLESIKNLNLWGNDLEDISVIRNMYNLEVVSLSVNKIRTLRDFSGLKNLRELYLRKNSIGDLNEVRSLVNLSQLRVLWLSENPVAEVKNYRSTIIKLLPQITKLDDNVISPEERANNNEDAWDDEEEDLGDQQENVFETDNVVSAGNNYGNKDLDYSRDRNRDYKRDTSPMEPKRENQYNNEIYSNNEKNKKMKDKFNYMSGQGGNVPINNGNKKFSANFEDNTFMQNFDNMNVKEKEIPVMKQAKERAIPQKRNTANSGYDPYGENLNINENNSGVGVGVNNKYENKNSKYDNPYDNYEKKKNHPEKFDP